MTRPPWDNPKDPPLWQLPFLALLDWPTYVVAAIVGAIFYLF